MIPVICRSNLDEFPRHHWPTQLAGMPRIGDRVKARDGFMLYVVSVTHVEMGVEVELYRLESEPNRK